jgi:hypothetical protein
MRLTCKQATELVSQRLDRELSAWERIKLRLHLLICDACGKFARQTDFMRRAMQRLVAHVEQDDNAPPR